MNSKIGMKRQKISSRGVKDFGWEGSKCFVLIMLSCFIFPKQTHFASKTSAQLRCQLCTEPLCQSQIETFPLQTKARARNESFQLVPCQNPHKNRAGNVGFGHFITKLLLLVSISVVNPFHPHPWRFKTLSHHFSSAPSTSSGFKWNKIGSHCEDLGKAITARLGS